MPSPMEALRESTRPSHTALEKHELQAALASGKLSLDHYLDYLAQFALIHEKLESRLDLVKDAEPRVRYASARLLPYLVSDLDHFGIELKHLEQLPATEQICADIEKCSPVALLGVYYVLLGSKHGGRMMAPTIAKQYGLTGAAGRSYFDPFGDRFPAMWKEFVNQTNELKLSEQELDELCTSATVFFAGIYKLCSQIWKAPVGAG